MIEEAPNVLTIHLKRFQYGGFGSKVTKHVAFETELNLQHYMSNKDAGPQVRALGRRARRMRLGASAERWRCCARGRAGPLAHARLHASCASS